MCGRYALFIRATQARRQLDQAGMPSQDAPDDDEIRQSYNFAPGYTGLVYRADVPDTGAGSSSRPRQAENEDGESVAAKDGAETDAAQAEDAADHGKNRETSYKLQAMKWGLVPFWTKRNPGYGSLMKTINCRDDSLIENRGMWTSMKLRKRCIIVCQGFYEWLKKNNGKEKVPHYIRRKDGQLLCFAGLWDCVTYEDSNEKLYSYTIITTDVNKQLKFLHDRMPVIFENGSDDIWKWLDPNRTEWTKELQSLLRPYEGELECYPVSKEVGKVGNNSPSFIVPIDSSENKNNIANFFGSQKKMAKGGEVKKEIAEEEENAKAEGTEVKTLPDEHRNTTDAHGTENNAPVPAPGLVESRGIKREHEDEEQDDEKTKISSPDKKLRKVSAGGSQESQSPAKAARKTRSATSNEKTPKSSPVKGGNGSQKITAFFGSK